MLKDKALNLFHRKAKTGFPVVFSLPVFWFFVLPGALLSLLICAAPQELDLAVSRLFYSGGWPYHGIGWITAWLHKAPKAVPVLLALFAVGYLVRARRASRNLWQNENTRRGLYFVTAMAAAATVVWLLKATTGVSCPWGVEAFGGSNPISEPSLSYLFREGNCWPSGHAGTGFVLFAAYFALRDVNARYARLAFCGAALLGIVCGAVRVMQGAHFVSHVAATALIDWLVCAALYAVFFPHALLASCRKAVCRRDTLRGTAFLALFTALWWTAVYDAPFFKVLLGINSEMPLETGKLVFALAVFAAFSLVSAALAGLITLLPQTPARILLLILAVSGSSVFVGSVLYGIVFTPDMARNFMATDAREAGAYLSAKTLIISLSASLPLIWVTLFSTIKTRGAAHPLRGGLAKAGVSLTLLLAGTGLLVTQLQSFSGLMREQKQLRYTIAPVSAVYSVASTLLRDEAPGERVRTLIDPEPKLATDVTRPAVMVLVIGETARAANWGLNGYSRDTTPGLARLNVINFTNVESCGTSTDVSLPCMMSRIGRSDYDRDRILAEEALPSLLKRAGANVIWVDNQSGCKGTCDGVTVRKPVADEKNCPNGLCYDTVLVEELERDLTGLPTDRPTVLIYHMFGQHGPRYALNTPQSTKVWFPECTQADLGSCSKEAVRNAYDNSIRNTDAVLSGLIAALQKREDIVSSLFYISDHGESLGEKGLFLHGAPYFMAPAEQTRVPMVLWLSRAWEKTFGVRDEVLRAQSDSPVTQEHVFSTVLGLLNVKSRAYRPGWDLTRRTDQQPQG